jgi:hypothetical protein
LTACRFKNYEAAYKQGRVNDKDYGSISSAAQSTSSVAPIKPGENTAWGEKDDNDNDDDDEEEEETEAGMLTPHHHHHPSPQTPSN